MIVLSHTFVLALAVATLLSIFLMMVAIGAVLNSTRKIVENRAAMLHQFIREEISRQISAAFSDVADELQEAGQVDTFDDATTEA